MCYLITSIIQLKTNQTIENFRHPDDLNRIQVVRVDGLKKG